MSSHLPRAALDPTAFKASLNKISSEFSGYRSKTPVDKNKIVAHILEELADPQNVDERFNRYRVPQATGSEKLDDPAAILDKLIEDGGRTAFAISHNVAQAQKGWVNLPDGLRNRHADAFVRLGLEMLAGFCVPSQKNGQFRELPLKILIVDNRPEELLEYNELLPPELGYYFWESCERWIWHIRGEDDCDELRKWLGGDTNTNALQPWDSPEDRRPPPSEFDLVLQDQFLMTKTDGLALADAYYESMPQALVFVTTGLDIGNLSALSQSRAVDRILPKNRLAALPWYYYLAFMDVLGPMFWDSWLAASDEGKENFLERRKTLRNLLGTIRRWQREPEILWHGQALAEMVDHGHQHINDLWRLTQEVVGARDSEGEPLIDRRKISTAERVLVSLGIWLHDVGHRGDDHSTDPAGIRDVHGSISERLLLQKPRAFGLDWLCDEKTARRLLRSRNSIPGRKARVGRDVGQIHPLRLAGLLCRHHQSSAPLFRASLAGLHFSLKFPSDYARVARVEGKDAADPLREWRDADEDLGWQGFEIRTLEDFHESVLDVDLLKCACLLRFLDGIHLTRRRTGSRYRIETHRLYRENRATWTDNRLRELRLLLSRTTVGSKAYLAFLGEMLQLESYGELLQVQDVHLWRQFCVENIRAHASAKRITITYSFAPSAGFFWENDELFERCRTALEKKYRTKGERATWWAHFLEECVRSELESQQWHESESYLLTNVLKDLEVTFACEGAGEPLSRSLAAVLRPEAT